jgi:hypothetical protein
LGAEALKKGVFMFILGMSILDEEEGKLFKPIFCAWCCWENELEVDEAERGEPGEPGREVKNGYVLTMGDSGEPEREVESGEGEAGERMELSCRVRWRGVVLVEVRPQLL